MKKYMKSIDVVIVLACVWGLSLDIASAQNYKPGEVIVKLRGDVKSVTATSFLGKVQMGKSMKLNRSWKALNIHHFKAAEGQTTQQLVDEYRNDPSVKYVEPNYIYSKSDVGVLEEGLLKSDVSISGASGSYGQNSAAVQAQDAWGLLSSGNAKPIVAVIDTGVDYNHEVFQQSNAMWTNTAEIPNNGVDDDGNGYIDDVRGWNFVSNNNSPYDDNNHGTHVAGIVLGAGQDILNTTPVGESRIQIMPLKFLDSNGSGSTSDAVSAIYYAVNNGAKVLNNSWGGGGYSAALHEAIIYSYNAKTLFIAAAGNETNNNDSAPTYPANYDVPHVLSIAATRDSDSLASFSNYGFATVPVGSPGNSILSTFPNNTYGISSGTSMAAPLVAGLAALLMYERPEMIGYQAKNIALDTSEYAASLSSKVSKESRVNIFRSVASAQGVALDSSQPSYDASVGQFGRDLASAMDKGGACGLVRETLKNPAQYPLELGVLFLFVLALPMVVLQQMRRRGSQPTENRRHERFEIDSQVAFTIGGKTMNGNINSISQGGVQLNTEEMLSSGSIVTMSISSPEGEEQLQVQGNIVWSNEQKSYGVQFKEVGDKVAESISEWTKDLKVEKG